MAVSHFDLQSLTRTINELEKIRLEAAKAQETAVAKVKDELTMAEKQIDLLLDMRLNEQIDKSEYVLKKHTLLNRKAELRGKLEAFEHNRLNRFEP